MSVKKLQLTLAERQVIALLIGDPRDGKVDASRMVRHVRNKLDLKSITRRLARINRHLKEFELPELGWEDLLDPSNLVEQIEELVSKSGDEDDRAELAVLLKDVQSIAQVGEVTLDDAHLGWLRDLIVDKDWRKSEKVKNDGRIEDVTPTVPAALLEAFANVADVVASGLANEEGTMDSKN